VILRKYQSEFLEMVKQEMRKGKTSVLSVLPCGAGKSIIAADIARAATGKGNRVLFVVHREELCKQIRETFINYGVGMELCTIGMIQSIHNKTASIEEPTLIIIDEAHHEASKTYRKLKEAFPNAWRIGLTATPERLDRQKLDFDAIVKGVTARWLIENGFLSPCKLYSMPLADVSELEVRRGEYDMGSVMENVQIYGDTVEAYKKLACGLKAIAFCSSVKAAEETAKKFTQNGVNAQAISGSTNKRQREQAMEDFRNGKILVLCNCEILSEGECLALLKLA
jgi:superfamily II DNA or RNA helicase